MKSLGVDLGGTWMRAAFFDSRVGRLKKTRRRAVPLHELPSALTRLFPASRPRPLPFRKNKERYGRLVLGGRGLWETQKRSAALAILRGAADRVLVISDLELAHAAAFAGGPGVVILAGTGAAALAWDSRGRIRRAGGLGPLFGDEGSAFWLGRAACLDPSLRAKIPGADPLRLAHADDPVRAAASLAPQVLALAAKDSRARRLRRAAARSLACLVKESVRGLSFRGPITASWQGGLFGDLPLMADFERELSRQGSFSLRPPLLKPHAAAALLPERLLAGHYYPQG